jgi:hypothetical protein
LEAFSKCDDRKKMNVPRRPPKRAPVRARTWSMIPKSGYRFSVKIMLKPNNLEHDPEKHALGL